MLRLEDLNQNYKYYQEFGRRLGLGPLLDSDRFASLKGSMDNRGRIRHSLSDWNPAEKRDFDRVLEAFGDPYANIKTTQW